MRIKMNADDPMRQHLEVIVSYYPVVRSCDDPEGNNRWLQAVAVGDY